MVWAKWRFVYIKASSTLLTAKLVIVPVILMSVMKGAFLCLDSNRK
jgi:hypothetical protein